MRTVRIAPSILSADFVRIGEIIKGLEKSGVDRIHIDVMDGHFVDNITFGPALIESIRQVTGLPFETHLMIENPGRYVRRFIDAGSDAVIVHCEADRSLSRTLDAIRSCRCEAGIAVSPPTRIKPVLRHLRNADMLLVMSVNPGFGGQRFIPGALGKIREARMFIDSHGYRTSIGVDGGVDASTAAPTVAAGVDELVIGSAILKSKNMAAEVRRFRTICKMAGMGPDGL